MGVYGVMAYTVSQRIPEIGVRMALGASPGRVVAMVVWQGARLALTGIGIGLVAAASSRPAAQHLLFDVRGLDPLTFILPRSILATAALLASYIPALRAARVSPSRALNRPMRDQASIFVTTSPWTSVRRKSRPWNLYVSFL